MNNIDPITGVLAAGVCASWLTAYYAGMARRRWEKARDEAEAQAPEFTEESEEPGDCNHSDVARIYVTVDELSFCFVSYGPINAGTVDGIRGWLEMCHGTESADLIMPAVLDAIAAHESRQLDLEHQQLGGAA